MRERIRRYDISECGEETDQEHGERFVESSVGRDEEAHNGAKTRQEGGKEGSEIGAELRSTEEEQDRCVFGSILFGARGRRGNGLELREEGLEKLEGNVAVAVEEDFDGEESSVVNHRTLVLTELRVSKGERTHLEKQLEEGGIKVRTDEGNHLRDQDQVVEDVLVSVLVELLAQNVQLANHLTRGQDETVLGVLFQNRTDSILRRVAHLGAVIHAQGQQHRERSLDDTRLPQLVRFLLGKEDLSQTASERTHGRRFDFAFMRLVRVREDLKTVIALQPLHALRHGGKHELKKIQQLRLHTFQTPTLRCRSVFPVRDDMMQEKYSTGDAIYSACPFADRIMSSIAPNTL